MNRDNLGRFQKGITPWNKDTRGVMKPNKTSFTKETVTRKYDFFEPRFSKDSLICTVLETRPTKSSTGKVYQHHKRVSYPRVLMEQHLNRPLSKSEVVLHLDENIYNNDLSNLKVITRAELAKLNHMKNK